MVGGRYVDPATGAFGGAPYGATNGVRGVPKWMGRKCRKEEEEGRRWTAALRIQNEDPTHRRVGKKGEEVSGARRCEFKTTTQLTGGLGIYFLGGG